MSPFIDSPESGSETASSTLEVNQERSWPTLGVVGDSFGSINSLFSGLALAAVALSLFLQMKELRLTRKELIEQKEQFKKTAEATHQSNLLSEKEQYYRITYRLSRAF